MTYKFMRNLGETKLNISVHQYYLAFEAFPSALALASSALYLSSRCLRASSTVAGGGGAP